MPVADATGSWQRVSEGCSCGSRRHVLREAQTTCAPSVLSSSAKGHFACSQERECGPVLSGDQVSAGRDAIGVGPNARRAPLTAVATLA